MAEQLEAAGFEIAIDDLGGGSFLTEGPFAADALAAAHSGGSNGNSDLWDVALFAWAGGPWPGLQSGAFRGRSSANPYGYADPQFDAESSRCDSLSNNSERSACYQGLDRFVTTLDQGENGLFVIPLLERPEVVAFNAASVAAMPVLNDGPDGGPLAEFTAYRLN